MRKRLEERFPDLRTRPAAAYAVAAALGLAAILVRAIIDANLSGYPFTFVFPAVILSSFVAGFWPGIVTAAIGAIGAAYLVFQPTQSVAIAAPHDWLAMGVYLFTSMLIALGFDRLRRSADMNRSLAENRQVLLLELQHRVKNHIQLVSALLALQARESANAELKAGLDHARRRIMAVGSAYSNLYAPGATVEFAAHLCQVTHELETAFARPGLKVEVRAVEAHMSMDMVVPLTLIAGELITNTFKHARIAPGSPSVLVEFRAVDERRYRLSVIDHGKLPDDFSLKTHAGLGLKIADQLAQQIDGVLDYAREPVTFCVTFPKRSA
jgi:two-component system, sensor histidine kinase PdtaS